MALPTKTNLETLDYSYGGVPFVSVAAKAGINSNTLDYSYGGIPFWGVEAGGTPEPPVLGSVTILPNLFAVGTYGRKVSIKSTNGRLG